MQSRLDDYAQRRPLSLRAGTFNVNGKDPSGLLTSFLGSLTSEEQSKKSPSMLMLPDLFVFSFQELDLSSQALIYQTTPRKEELWLNAIMEALGSASTDYVKVRLGLSYSVTRTVLKFVLLSIANIQAVGWDVDTGNSSQVNQALHRRCLLHVFRPGRHVAWQ